MLNDERGHTSSYITAAKAVIFPESIHLDEGIISYCTQGIKVALIQHFKLYCFIDVYNCMPVNTNGNYVNVQEQKVLD